MNANPRKVASAGFPMFPVGEGDVAAVPPGSGALIVPAFAADLLVSSGEFRTPDEHLARYAARYGIGPSDADALRGWMAAFEQHGLLAGEDALVPQPAETAWRPGQIGMLGIPSGGDAARIRACASGFLENAAAAGRALHLVVADGSPDPSAFANNGEWLSRAVSASGARLTHLGRDTSLALATRLAREAGAGPELAAFAVSDPENAGFAAGANRNVLLLLGAGHLVASTDDDVTARSTAPADPDSFGMYSVRDAIARRFFASREEACLAADWVDGRDLLADHEAWLGAPLGECFARWRYRGFTGVAAPLLKRLREAPGRVVASFWGHAPDPGVPTSYYYLGLRGTNLRALAAAEPAYRNALRARAVLAAAPRRTVGEPALTPGMAFALDARDLVPPFFPVFHAEDFSWGAVLARTRPDALAGHVPVAIHHDPGPGKPIMSPGDGEPVPAVFEAAHIVRQLALAWPAPAGLGDPAHRMESLGAWLTAHAAAPPRVWRDFLHESILAWKSAEIAWHEESLESEESAPDWWRSDVAAYLAGVRKALATPGADIPRDLRHFGDERARSILQSTLRRYGELLQAWPAIFAAAARSNG